MAKFLMPLTQPVGILWLCLLALAGFHASRRQWRHLVLPLALAALISLLGGTTLPARLLATLERPYAAASLPAVAPADAVVMLGGVLERSPNDVFKFDLNDAADRVITAVELMRQGKARALVLGGAGPPPGVSGPAEGELVRQWLTAWGQTNAPIHLLGMCVDTHDEAVRTQALCTKQRWQRVILVTSAGHMRRAEATFRRLGLPVSCVACDFRSKPELGYPMAKSAFPVVNNLDLLGLYLHEQIGWWVYRWHGWV